MLETDMWDEVRRGVGPLWRSQRIEDSISSDIPDVFFSISHGQGRISALLELKVASCGKRGGLSAPHYTQGQRDFADIHGTVFLLVYAGGYWLLFDHTHVQDILKGQSLDWHIQYSIGSWGKPSWGKLIDLLKVHILQCPQH